MLKRGWFFIPTILGVFAVSSWSQYKGESFFVGSLDAPQQLTILVDEEAIVLQHPFFSAPENNRCWDDPKFATLQSFCQTPYPGVWGQIRDQAQSAEVNDAARQEAAELVKQAWRTSGEQIARTKFSPELRARLAEVWTEIVPQVEVFKGQGQLEGFDYEKWGVVFSLESLIAARSEFGLKSTELLLQHEFGHALLFLLNPGRSAQHCAEDSVPKLTVCNQARAVMKAMSDLDRQLIEDWVKCVDRRTVFGEWLSVRSRTPLGERGVLASGPRQDAVVNRRGEVLADDWAMGVMRSQGKSLADQDLWPLCRTTQGRDLLSEFRDPHPENLFRVQVLGEQVEEVKQYWTRRCEQWIM